VGDVVLLTGKGAEFTESGANITTAPRDTASPIAILGLFIIERSLEVIAAAIMAESRTAIIRKRH
jgi:hypothetical protein